MKRLLSILFIALFCTSAAAQVNEEELKTEAESLFEEGKYRDAHPLYSQLVSLHPRNQEYNFRFGASTIFNGSDYETAIKHLKFATHKTGVDPRAHYYLGLAQQLNYEFSDAVRAFNNFQNLADGKTIEKFDVDRRIEQCKSGQGLLSEIKDVVVLEKTESRTNDFFRFFNLDAMGGRILAMPEELKTKEDKKRGGNALIYYPGSTAQIYFSSYGKDGSTGKDIYRAFILPDGTFSKPEILKGKVNTPFDEDYAFIHPDGKTLYFCSTGHNSMGGFDIFRSIYDEATDSFGPPQNLDFAINTPDDDIFFVTDSLSNIACFASGRSSAQGDLSVYKVRVEGIPVKVVFISGDFISELTPGNRKARIRVKDELTGRPIEDTFSATDDGQYVISLPKAGRYLFEVETQSSPVIHEGIVEVPSFNEPVVLRQELQIIKDGGSERLVINNFFDDPMMDKVAEFTAQMMRKKAGLEVNATPELLASLDEDSKMTVEKSLDNAAMLAGFSDDKSVNDLVSEIRKDAESGAERSKLLNDKANNAYAFAKKEFEESQSLLQEAETLKSQYDGSREPDQVKKLRDSQKKVALAEEKLDNSKNSIALADSTKAYAAKLSAEASVKAQKASELESAVASNDVDKVVDLLKEEKAKREAATLALASPGEKAEEESLNKRAEADEVIRTVNRLRSEEAELTTAIRKAEREKETAKKKDKEELEQRIATLTTEQEDIRTRIERENGKIKEIEEEGNDLALQSKLYDEIIEGDQAASLTGTQLSSSEKSELLSSIDQSETRISEVKVTDSETLALLGEETVVTRNDLVQILKLPPTEAESELALKPVSGIESEFVESVELLTPKANQREFAYKMNLIQAGSLSEINRREAELMTMKNNGSVSDDEFNRQQEELIKAKETLTGNDIPAYRNPVQKLDKEQQKEVLRSLSQEYAGYQPSGEQWKDELKMLSIAQNSTAKAEEKIIENNQRILNSEDDTEIRSLVEENEKLSAYLESVPDFKGLANVDKAHREALADMSASSQSVQGRLQQQKTMTEDYLELLDEYQENLESASNNEPENEAYFKAINQLNAFKESAQLRLSGIESDFETAGDELVADNTVETPANTNTQEETTAEPQAGDETAAANNITESNTEETTSENAALKSVTDDRVKEEVELKPVPASTDLPDDRNAMLLTLMPNYPLEGTAEAAAIKSLGERVEVEKSFIDVLDKTIENREVYIAQNQTEEETQRVETELSQLRALKRKSELSIMQWEAQSESEDADVIAAELGIGTTLEDSDKESFELIHTAADKEDPKKIYESNSFDQLVDNNTNSSYAINNMEQILELRNEIDEKERELRQEDKESKQKKLDKKIENLYTKIAFMEIGNGSKLRSMAEVEYDKNDAEIDALWEEKDDLLLKHEYFDDRVSDYTDKADELFEEAKIIRENAGKVGDPIEKNYRYREAFAMEAQALENQKRSLEILRNLESLAGKEEVYLASLNAEEKAAENADALAAMEAQKAAEKAAREAAEQEEQASNEEQSTQNEAEGLAEIADTTSNLNEEETENPSGQELAEELSEESSENEVKAPVMTADPFLEARMAQVKQMTSFENSGLSEEEVEKRRRSDAYVRYQQLLNEAENKNTALADVLQERNDLAAETAKIESQIDKLEKAMESESDEAVKSGMQEEVKRLRSQARVNYSRTELLDEQIRSEEAMLSNLLDEAEVLAERVGAEPASIAAKPIENPVVSAEMNYVEAEDYLFSYPKDLDANVFKVMDGAPYSASSPIPMNPAMPDGVVFKVQVGAFKNDIPQDLFGGFAPISGETLNNGITRYTVGLFRQYVAADLAKGDIRGMGYPDAFVVAFIDGRRVPLYEALAQLGEEDLAQLSKNATNQEGSTNNPTNESVTNSNESNAEQAVQNNTENNSTNLSEADRGRDFTPSVEDVRYYNEAEGAAEANQIEALEGLFYTVQVGVYSNPVSARDLKYISPLNSESTTGGRVRYTTGIYNNLKEASQRKDAIRELGVEDAFVTAYYNGSRITIGRAAELYEQIGPNVLNVTDKLSDKNAVNEWDFEVFIGAYSGEVPANVARAMLFLEESRGIVQRNNGDMVEYYTGKVNSLKTARLIQSEFERYDVNNTEVIGYENGLRKDLNEYTGE